MLYYESYTKFIIMLETSSQTPMPVSNVEHPNDEQGAVVGLLKEKRAVFVKDLVSHGMISEAIANSGDLDMFEIDAATRHDSLIHLLVGDQNGGAHHMRSIFELGMSNVGVASEVRPGADAATQARLRRQQKARPNGEYKSRVILINGQRKEGGSSMFPEAWTAEEVIQSVVSTAKEEPSSHDSVRRSYVHKKVVNGVKIRAVTSQETGKIVTASPKVTN
jgi:hypothetical protein